MLSFPQVIAYNPGRSPNSYDSAIDGAVPEVFGADSRGEQVLSFLRQPAAGFADGRAGTCSAAGCCPPGLGPGTGARTGTLPRARLRWSGWFAVRSAGAAVRGARAGTVRPSTRGSLRGARAGTVRPSARRFAVRGTAGWSVPGAGRSAAIRGPGNAGLSAGGGSRMGSSAATAAPSPAGLGSSTAYARAGGLTGRPEPIRHDVASRGGWRRTRSACAGRSRRVA